MNNLTAIPLVRRAAATALLTPLGLLAACGDDGSDSNSDMETTSTMESMATETTGAPDSSETTMADHSKSAGKDADIAFAQGMIMHHQQAVELSEIALDPTRGASPKVTDLATRIKSAQDPEIDQMKAMLKRWGAPEEMDMTKPHDMSSMEGMVSNDDITKLEALNGAEFDTRWAELMKAHHQGAVTSAKAVIADGEDAELDALAQAIVTAQTSEITELDAIINAG